MEVKFLTSDYYDQWDSFVDESPQGDIFCYSWWLEAITKSNYKILVIIEENVIVAGIPLALDNQNKINIPPVTRTSGVLYNHQENISARNRKSLERKWMKALLDLIPPDDFVQMCFHQNFTDWLPFRWKGFRQTTRYTYLIDCKDHSPDDLWNNLDIETQRVIRRAKENGITVETTDDFELVYKYEELSYKRQGLSFRIPYNDLKSLDNAIKQREKRVIFKAASIDGSVHATLYAAFNQRSAYALLSGGDPELRKMGGHTLIMWEAIRYFSGKVNCFNMGGSDIERIEAHLKGFGGTLTPYFLIYNENLAEKPNDFRYHLKQVYFHFVEALKILKNKLFLKLNARNISKRTQI
jgi:hypothetical protein